MTGRQQKVESALLALFDAHSRVVEAGARKKIAETAVDWALREIQSLEQSGEEESDALTGTRADSLTLDDLRDLESVEAVESGGVNGPFEGPPDDSPETGEEEEEFEEVFGPFESNHGEIEPNDEVAAGGSSHSKGGYELEVEMGERHQQTLEFFDDHSGEWVDYRDFGEWLGEDPDEKQTICSRALRNFLDREGELAGELETALRPGPLGPRRRYYRYWPPGSERRSEGEEGEADQSPSGDEELAEIASESAERRPPFEKGSHAHQTLALLTHLYEKTGERQGREDLAEYGRLTSSQFSQACSQLKLKGYVDKMNGKREGKGGAPPALWAPTEKGKEALDEVGGFQLNSSTEESEA